MLLGVRGIGVPGVPTYREETRALAPGATLIFYTDGLVDRRARADGPGHYDDAEVFAMLSESVKAVADEGVELIAEAAEHAVPGNIDDDMAILVVRTATEELATWDTKFPAEPIKVSEARRMRVRDVRRVRDGQRAGGAGLPAGLRGGHQRRAAHGRSAEPAARVRSTQSARSGSVEDWLDSPLNEDFVSAEGQEFTLRIRKGADSVWVEVFDSDLRLPRIRMAGENDEGGRGLYLVDQLAARWGSRPTEDGKAVWFEMPIKTASSSLLSMAAA